MYHRLIFIQYTGQESERGTVFNPGFPVTCPFVTAVGATQVDPGNTVNDPEGACEQVIFSGGGFSNFFAMPSFQADAVTGFLTNHPPPFTSAQFNDSGNVSPKRPLFFSCFPFRLKSGERLTECACYL